MQNNKYKIISIKKYITKKCVKKNYLRYTFNKIKNRKDDSIHGNI